eukprot:gene4462-14615_t
MKSHEQPCPGSFVLAFSRGRPVSTVSPSGNEVFWSAPSWTRPGSGVKEPLVHSALHPEAGITRT